MPPVLSILVGIVTTLVVALRMTFNKYWSTRLEIEGRDVAMLGQLLFEPIFMTAASILLS